MLLRLLVLTLTALLPACAPVFSDLQSARTLGKGHLELTPSFSSTAWTDPDTTAQVQTHLGLQFAAGASDVLDLRFRFERVSMTGDDDPRTRDDIPSVNVVALGPKVRLVKGVVAAYLPVGFAFGRDVDVSETWEMQPTLLVTAPLARSAELNLSAKYIVLLSREAEAEDNLVAFNVGLGLGPKLDRWVLRPEIGFLFNPGEEGHFTHFSLGLALKLR